MKITMESPSKPVQRVTHSRQTHSELLRDSGLPASNPSFVNDHLNNDSELPSIAKSTTVSQLVDEYAKDPMNSNYTLMCKLLNAISEGVHGVFCCLFSIPRLKSPSIDSPAANTELIVFIDHHTAELKYHPKNSKAKPDLIAVNESFLNCYNPSDGPCTFAPWHATISPCEAKTKTNENEGDPQAATYLALLNQARPDMPGAYGLSISPQNYSILYSDPSGIFQSPTYTMTVDQLEPLIQYVYTLYHSRDDRFARDPSVTLANSDPLHSPQWNVTSGGVTYEDCMVTAVGEPWTRMTWVAISRCPESGLPVAIKDSYRSIGRTWKEGDLFDLLQEKEELPQENCMDPETHKYQYPPQAGPAFGPAPGWVHVLSHDDVKVGSRVIETPVPDCRRIKARLIMDSVGEPLDKCKTLFDFFGAMYDVLEGAFVVRVSKRIKNNHVLLQRIGGPWLQRTFSTETLAIPISL